MSTKTKPPSDRSGGADGSDGEVPAPTTAEYEQRIAALLEEVAAHARAHKEQEAKSAQLLTQTEGAKAFAEFLAAIPQSVKEVFAAMHSDAERDVRNGPDNRGWKFNETKREETELRAAWLEQLLDLLDEIAV